MKKMGVLTSGGDAPGMNAAIRAVVRGALYNGMEPYGIERGFEGLMEGDMAVMHAASVSDIMQRGGTVLKTARSERFRTEEGQKMALNVLRSFGIEGLVIIGGDGSMKGGLQLAQHGINIMGLPGTIDNDLAYTEFSIGFDTAVNTVVSAVGNVRDTSSSHERTTVVEVMGRHCGDIALYSGLTSGAEIILIPERTVDIDAISRKMIQGRNRGKLHNIIIKAEGVNITTEELVRIIHEKTGMDTKLVVLGYVQRGGSPTARDRMLASRMGYRAIELLNEGVNCQAIGITGTKITNFDIEKALSMKRRHNENIIQLADILSI
ncbi:MAG: 6-phosphofructokinase [Peptostreptococcaceae bacterium]|nr:6-phosphofructokinase [Peptostreptococcaceae bacterium]